MADSEDIVSSVVTLLEQHAGTIAACRPRTRFNRCGYLLHDVLDAEQLDLARLLVGSEGTLALFTEATLRTIPLPGGRGGGPARLRQPGRGPARARNSCCRRDRRPAS